MSPESNEPLKLNDKEFPPCPVCGVTGIAEDFVEVKLADGTLVDTIPTSYTCVNPECPRNRWSTT